MQLGPMKRGSDAFPRGNEALSGAALLLNVAGGEGGPESGADAENAAAHAMVPRVRSAESTGASYRSCAAAYPPEPGSLRHIAAGGGEQLKQVQRQVEYRDEQGARL